ncbi:MAG: phosphatidylserine/phosphatidylglycerophosphate/cardiolipin synthase family protein [Pseudobdellovibrionaceae bacterium]
MTWTRFDLFYNGDSYFEKLIESINQAQKEILFEVYIFDLDSVGNSVMEALKNAAGRGVRVLLSVDGIGSFYYLEGLAKTAADAGIRFKAYHSLPLKPQFFPLLFRWKLWAHLSNFFSHVNKRNHRKLIVIDEMHAFVGSRNITQFHSERSMGEKAWRDTSALLEGPEVSLLRDAFLSTWGEKPTHFTKRALASRDVLINSKRKTRKKLQKNLLFHIRNAKKRIYITNAYFVPHRSLVRALKKAAANKNIDVCLLLPAISDIQLLLLLSRAFYSGLLKAGVKVFQYEKSVLHAKTMLIDDRASLGSFNFNHRSLIHDLEIVVLNNNPEVVQQFERQWEEDLSYSHLVNAKILADRSFIEKSGAWILYQLRYWL